MPRKVVAAWEPSAPGLWYCNWKIWLEARRRLDRALAPLELHAREFWMLAIAGRGNVSQHEIAALCGLDPSSLVAVLDGLERRGWLRRQPNPRDRRMHWVQRTEAGDRLFARALRALNVPRRGSWQRFPRPNSGSWWPPLRNWL